MPEIIQIDSTTWRIEDDFVRFFLLEGNEKAVLIDSGKFCPNACDIAKTLTDKPVILLNTHGDGDHTSGTNGFKEIHIHKADYIKCELDKKFPNTKLLEINDGDQIDLGGRLLQIIYIPGHTIGSVAILDSTNRTLYAGDSVQTGHIYMFGKHRIPEQYESSLDKLISLKDKYDAIYASHRDYKLPNNYTEKVRSAWDKIISGKVKYENIELLGTTVKSYTLDACGFYLD